MIHIGAKVLHTSNPLSGVEDIEHSSSEGGVYYNIMLAVGLDLMSAVITTSWSFCGSTSRPIAKPLRRRVLVNVNIIVTDVISDN